MTQIVLVFTERLHGYDAEYDLDDCFLSEESYEVDSSKLENFKKENDGEYRYIANIVEQAEATLDSMVPDSCTFLDSHSTKYSFSDSPEWYESLQPDVIEEDVIYINFCYDVYK